MSKIGPILHTLLGKLQAFWRENVQVYETDTPKWLIRQWKSKAEAKRGELEKQIKELEVVLLTKQKRLT
ncbi:hypothetical protein LCGC14_0399060 [marine sediment metagenome]|uniref:Uncharacterized protein n=1 Tax=marine sediment metagenome TaxID=412755 RepID=A0A0F9SXD5_9ZZZZ|nr:hypothetical protein [Candidatus Aminicenantes bacterium]